MKTLVQCMVIGLAGFAGSLARFGVSSLCGRWFGTAFPVGTLVVNLSGSLLLGWFLAVIDHRWMVSETTRVAIAVGFVGAFTTFSTLMYESSALMEGGAMNKAMANLIGNLLLGLICVKIGLWLGGR